MDIIIRNQTYKFDGPYGLANAGNLLRNQPGVYVIHCNSNGRVTRIDVGKSDESIHTRIMGHDRRDCWLSNCDGEVTVSVLYLPAQRDRDAWEQALRNEYDLPCGER